MLEALILLIIKRKKAFINTELVKNIGVSKDTWLYIIPTIGFTKTGKYFEVHISWLGFCIYIAYKFNEI